MIPLPSRIVLNQKLFAMGRQEDFEFFVKGEKSLLTIKHSAKDQTIEAAVGKAMKNFSGMSFGDSTAFPMILNEENIGVKVVID